MISVEKVLETRYMLSSGKFRIKIRVTFDLIEDGKKRWVQKYYPTDKEASIAEFQKIKSNPKSPRLKVLKMEINQLEERAQQIIKAYPSASIEFFEKMFRYNYQSLSEKTRISDLSVNEFELLMKRIIKETIIDLIKTKQVS